MNHLQSIAFYSREVTTARPKWDANVRIGTLVIHTDSHEVHLKARCSWYLKDQPKPLVYLEKISNCGIDSLARILQMSIVPAIGDDDERFVVCRQLFEKVGAA